MQADAQLRWLRKIITMSVNCEANSEATAQEAPTTNISNL